MHGQAKFKARTLIYHIASEAKNRVKIESKLLVVRCRRAALLACAAIAAGGGVAMWAVSGVGRDGGARRSFAAGPAAPGGRQEAPLGTTFLHCTARHCSGGDPHCRPVRTQVRPPPHVCDGLGLKIRVCWIRSF